ncbi:TRAP transporter large permease [Cyclobacterium marinum]|uniref:TRAP dicarboxylate transporter, DctM subunit n=1 Tax=Cyclobacterium marinum (strain ATCC 25205 / DSM 745 / LMG 13164 / NCIMB 1802) TaxID=880070 RepID=G0J5C3_CYCMS|nr:TRAP transporter large permease [Cyclobacterium marinum]AEL27559.1 TRAP dicarboxylate transporter, DctM subunit [Cyclobacterium marinum DSM 745]MBI0397329.1 TRAP transporter large permease [Cyclobacterium marinum]|tara:strand:- start:29993 stop:31291 length:1299 start_codon:yes stop_codon:yes gene_type:complete
MEEYLSILILIVSFIILMGIGVPVAWALGFSSFLTLTVTIASVPSATTIAQRMGVGLDSFALLAIPFFILAGEIMNKGGIANRLIDLAKAMTGRLPGGLLYVNVIAAMLFGAIAGSAAAAASAIGGILGPRMEKEGYPRELGASVNITASTTGLIIPPSNVLIVYSLASGGVSIAALFIAGYIPGLLIGMFLMITAAIFIKKHKLKPGEPTSVKELASKFLAAFPSLMLLVVVIGGIVIGVFTATEASAIAVVYTLVLSFIYGEIKLSNLPAILLKSSETTAIVMLLIATSMSMSWAMSSENIPQSISSALLTLSDNKFVILIMINLILLFVGTFMDMTPAVLIFTPIFLPAVVTLGIDPVHFGIMMVLNLCIGVCTPPVGSVLFIGVGVAKTTIAKVFFPLLPFFVAMLLGLLIITLVPELTLWLPSVFGL